MTILSDDFFCPIGENPVKRFAYIGSIVTIAFPTLNFYYQFKRVENKECDFEGTANFFPKGFKKR